MGNGGTASHRDAEVVFAFFAALNRLDAEAACAMVSDDYEGWAASAFPLGRGHRFWGKRGLRAWIELTAGACESFAVSPPVLRRYGDAIVGLSEYRALQRKDHRLGAEFAVVIRARNGLVRSVHAYRSLDEAIARERLPDAYDELEPA